MNRLLKIELLKISSYTTFLVLAGLTVGFYILILFAGTQINLDLDFDKYVDFEAYFRFSTVFQSIAYYSSWFFPLLSLLIIIITGNEFGFRTIRQNIIDGLSREEFFYSKIIVIVLLATAITFIAFISSFTVGSVFSGGFNNFHFSDLKYFISFFIQTVAYLSLAFLISLLLKSIGASIVVFLGYFIVELIIRAYFSILKLNFSAFLPAKVFSNLTPAPSITTMIKNDEIKIAINENIKTAGELSFNANLIVAVIYITLFLFLSYQVINKKDL